MGSLIRANDLIDYSGLLEKRYLYPYWQYYYKDINISFFTSDEAKELSLNRSDEKLTTFATRDDFVIFDSILIKHIKIFYNFQIHYHQINENKFAFSSISALFLMEIAKKLNKRFYENVFYVYFKNCRIIEIIFYV